MLKLLLKALEKSRKTRSLREQAGAGGSSGVRFVQLWFSVPIAPARSWTLSQARASLLLICRAEKGA